MELNGCSCNQPAVNDAPNCSSRDAGGGGERSREQVTVFECHLKFIFIILIVTGKISPSRPDYAGRENQDLNPNQSELEVFLQR